MMMFAISSGLVYRAGCGLSMQRSFFLLLVGGAEKHDMSFAPSRK